MKNKEQGPAYYPVFLNISGKKCVVVGGGQVALRKVKALLEHGAAVEVISPELNAGLKQLAESGKILTLNREYRAGDLKKALVAIAATDDAQTNHQVADEAGAEGVLVNVVDDARNSDFIAPSYLRRGDIVIAVSTSGRSPALARKIRARLEEDFGHEYDSLAQLIDEVRTEARQRGMVIEGDTWQEVLDLDSIMDTLKKGDRQKARGILLSNLEQATKTAR